MWRTEPLRPSSQMRRRNRSTYYRTALESLERRLVMSASPWSDLTREAADQLLSGKEFVANEFIVALKSSDTLPTFADILAIASARDAVLADTITGAQLLGDAATAAGAHLYSVTLAAGSDFAAVLADVSQWAEVEWASPNFIYTADPRDLTPNDPSYASQYHHALMQNSLAWDIGQGSGIVVAVTDDGVDWDHVDLAANMWVNSDEIAGNGIDDDANGFIDDVRGWDFSSNDNNPDHVSGDNHGTHVAGIIAAATNNAVGVAGTAGQATIMPVRFYGSGSWTSTVIYNSYKYATDNGAKIISTSYNIDGFASDPTFASAVNYAYLRGVLHFNSAGNNSQLNPARGIYDQMLFVASTDSLDAKSSFSNYGVKIDISAPGSSIYATLPNNTYGSMSGTSMATPNAAAVAALIWAANPTWTRDQVAAQLLATADNINAANPTYTGLLGTGRVNAYKALTQTIAPPRIAGVTEITGGTLGTVNKFTVQTTSRFAEATLEDAANWELRGDGADGIFDTADDVIVVMTRATDYMIGTNEVTFNFNTLATDRYQLRVKSGATGLKDPFGAQLDGDADGVAGGNYVREFSVTGPMVVTSSTPAAGTNVAPPLTTIELNFDRAIQSSSVSSSNLTLSRGTVTGYTVVDSDTVRFTVSGLTAEGALTYSIAAGAIRDSTGTAGAAFSATVQLDVDAMPFALTSIGPLHYFAQRGAYSAALSSGTDVDTFTMDLLAGQTLSIAAGPAAGLRTALTVTGPGGVNVQASSSSPGAAAILHSIQVAVAGTYTIAVSSLSGAGGSYSLDVAVNAELEAENFGAAPNSTAETAQSLDNAWVALGAGSARGVVAGTFDSSAAIVGTEGFEAGSLPAGWTTSSTNTGRITYSSSYFAAGSRSLLMDSTTDGSYSRNTADWTINLAGRTNVRLNFSQAEWGDEEDVLPATFVGSANGDGVAFSVDGNTWYRIWNPTNQSSGVWSNYTIDLSAAAAAAGVTLGADTRIRFQQYDDYAMTTDGRAWDAISVTADALVGQDDWYKFALTQGDVVSFDISTAGSAAVFELYDATGVRLAAAVGSPPAIERFSASTTGDYYLRINGSGGDYRVLFAKNTGVDLGGDDLLAGANFIGGVARLIGTAGPGSTDPDHYSFFLAAGVTLQASTATPLVGVVGAVNLLNPQLDLYDAVGNRVAGDLSSAGGGNATFTYTATTAGRYTLRVSGESGTGAYVVSLSGQATTDDVPTVVESLPAPGTIYRHLFDRWTVTFSEALALDGVDASDLLINGVAATGVTILGGNSLQFQFDPPARGNVTLELVTGGLCDLQGTSLPGQTFIVDYQLNTAPTIDNSVVMALTPVAEDSTNGVGMLIADLLATGAAGDPIYDPDLTDASGIAIVAASVSQGSWQFTTNGGTTWTDLGAVSTSAARLLAVDGQTRIRFTPAANVNGTVSPALTFRAWDVSSGSNGSTANVTTAGGSTAFSTGSATASLVIQAVNDAPSATAASYTVTTGSSFAIALAGSDNDAGVTQGLTYAIVTGPMHGTLSDFNSATGVVVYTPNAGYNGPDGFTFTVTDDATAGGPALTSAAATISLVVNPNVTSTLISNTTRRDHAYDDLRNVLYVATSDGKVQRYSGTSGALLGVWNLSTGNLNGMGTTPDGRYLYVGDGVASATQGFVYKIDLFSNQVSTLAYNLASGERGVWDLEVGADGVAFVSTQYSGSGWTSLRLLDTNTDTFTWVRTVGQSTQIAVSQDGGTFFFAESNLSSGPILSYSVATRSFVSSHNTNVFTDSLALGVHRTGASVAMETGSGIAIRNSTSLASNTANISGVVGGFVYDPLRDQIFAVNPTTDRVEVYSSTNSQLQYSFAVGQDAGTSATYGAGVMSISADGTKLFLSTSDGIRIYTLPVTDLPVAKADAYESTGAGTLSINATDGLIANDVNPLGGSTTATLVNGPRSGTLTLNADGSFQYTPNAGFTGSDTFRYRVDAGLTAGSTTLVSIKVRPTINSLPTANYDSYAVVSGSPLVVTADRGLLANDLDPEFDALTATVLVGPQHGTLTLNADGSFQYVAAAGFTGTDVFTYRATDALGAVADGTVVFQVVPNTAGTLLSLAARRDHVVDSLRNLLYVATTAGKIERYDIATGTWLSAWTLGTSALGGMDITVDGQYLFVGSAGTSGGQGSIFKVALADGTFSTINYTLGFGESGVWDLEISADGQAFFTTQYSGAGSTQLRQIDIASGVISTIRTIDQNTHVSRSADRSLVFFAESNSSSGPTWAYDARTQTFSSAFNANLYLGSSAVAVNRNGALVALELTGVTVVNRAFQGVATLNGLIGGIIFDPKQDILYAIDDAADQLVAVDTNTWRELYRRSIGENVTTSVPFGAGEMSISDDGRKLFLSTAAGIRMFELAGVTQPLATDDSYLAVSGFPLVVAAAQGILANDLDPLSGTSSASLLSGPRSGALTLNADGSFTYAPTAAFTGTDAFTYLMATAGGGYDVATVVVNVSQVNAAPGFVKGANITTTNAGLKSYTAWATGITAGIGDVGQMLAFDVTTDNPTLFSVAPQITTQGNLTFTAAPGVYGSAVVTVVLRDDGGTAHGGVNASAPQTFTIRIADPPTISAIAAQTINEDETATIDFTVSDPDTSLPLSAITAVSSNATLVPNANLSIQHLGGVNYRLTAVPVANTPGNGTITVIASDDLGSVMRTFTLNVVSINDAPSFVKGADIALAGGTTPQSFVNWATSISAGPNEPTQAVSLSVISSNPALFSSGPAINNVGTLSFTPTGVFGTAVVTVAAVDNGGTTNGGVNTSAPQTFTITVGNVGGSAAVTPIADVTILEDSATGPIEFSISHPTLPASSLSVSLATSNSALVTLGNLALTNLGGGNYSLVATPTANANGSSIVTVRVSDGSVTYARSFTLNVTPVNDIPTFVKGADQSAVAGSGTKNVFNWATSISAGTGDVGQTYSFLVTTDHPEYFSTQPTIDPSGRLSYAPAVGASGIAVVTVVLQDTGGTANGGVNTSAPQTFNISLTSQPIIGPIAAQTTLEDTPAVVNFTVTDPDTPLSALTVSVASSNTTLFPAGSLGLTSDDAGNWQLTATPAANLSGSATITVTVTGDGPAVTRTFTLAVTAVNDAPSFVKGADITVPQHATTQWFYNWASAISAGPNESQNVTFSLTVDDPTLFATLPSINSWNELSFRQASGKFGTATVTVVLRDDGGTANGGIDVSAPQTFTITINSPPVIGAIVEQTTLEDTPIVVPFTVTDPDTPAGQLTVTVGGNNSTLFPSGSLTVVNNGAGNYQIQAVPAANQFGSATITITANDGALTVLQTFYLNVTAVNDAPSFVKGADQTVPRNAVAQSIANWATGLSAGPNESQSLNFIVTTDNPSLFTVGPAISSSGTLTYTPSGGVGTATVTVRVQDSGGTANGGVDLSPPQTFTITVFDVPITPGLLDPSFDFDGRVQPPSLAGGADYGRDVLLQPDGKIVVVGYDAADGAFVVRYNSDGTLDGTFGVGGKTVVKGASTGNRAYAVERQSDGKLLIAGESNSDLFLARLNVDGTLDSTFGAAGVVVNTSWGSSYGRGMALQSDGKIVVVGYNSTSDYVVARYTTAGTLDTTFGTGGSLTLAVDTSTDEAADVAVQNDGRIVIVGRSYVSAGGNYQLSAVRLLTDGTLDTSFSGDGKVIINTNGTSTDRVALQTDGKIVIAGRHSSQVNVVRLNVDGTLDTTFSGDGIFTTSGDIRSANALALTPDGKIVVGGYQYVGNVNLWHVTRLDGNGTLDPTFNSTGFRNLDLSSRFTSTLDAIYGLAVAADGKIIAVGSGNFGNGQDLTLARFSADGTLDASFGNAGLVVEPMSFKGTDSVRAVQVLPDGKLIVAGLSYEDNSDRFALWKLNPDGSFDTSFGVGGRARPTATFNSSTRMQLIVQPDGKLIVTAYSTVSANVFRFHADGTLDLSFSGDGVAGGPTNFSIQDVALQADGKIVLSGAWNNGNNSDFAVVRMLSDGTLDTTFDGDGMATVVIGPSTDTANSVAILADGKILLGGTSAHNLGDRFALARFHADGTLDTSFGVAGVATYQTADSAGTARTLLIDRDGKILLAGNGTVAGNQQFIVARFHPDGTLDSTFDGDGIAVVGTAGSDTAQEMALQADGKIIVSGSDGSQFITVRLQTNGALDTSFDGDGIVTTDFGTSEDVRGVVIQANGRIVVAGAGTNGETRLALARYYGLIGEIAAPTIAPVADVVVDEGATPAQVTLSVSDADTPLAGLSVWAQSDDAGLLPVTGIAVVDLGGGSYRLTLSPSADRFGTTQIRVYVSDGANVASTTFSYQVVGVNDAPSFDKGPDLVVHSGGGLTTIEGWARNISAGMFESAQILTFDVTTDNPALFDVAPQIAADGTLTFGAGSATGSATVTIRLRDDGGTASGGVNQSTAQSFTIQVGRAPAISFISDQTTVEDGAPIVVDFTVTDADTLLNELLVTARSGDLAILPEQGISLQSLGIGFWRLTATPAADRFGSAAITVTVSDGAPVSTLFVLNVTPVNDVPSFQMPAARTSSIFDGTQVVENWAYDISAGRYETGQSLTFEISADNPSLFAQLPTIDEVGTLRYRSSGIAGDAVLTVVLRDSAGAVAATRTLTLHFVNGVRNAGNLDPALNGDGVVTLTGTGGSIDAAKEFALLPDGKYLVVGSFSGSGAAPFGYAVTRFNADGTVDTSFADGGKLRAPTGFIWNTIEALSDGKFLVAGSADSDFYVARFTASGALDTSFGSGGIIKTAIGNGTGTNIEEAFGMAVQSNGSIVVVGRAYSTVTSYDLAFARYTGAGLLDTSFSGDGILTYSFTAGTTTVETLYDVVVQSDGSIVAVGNYSSSSTSSTAVIVRLSSSGTVNAGSAYTFAGRDVFYRVARQTDGKFVVAGSSGSGGDFLVARFTSSISLDSSFASGSGYARTDMGSTADVARGLAIQSDGKILVAGATAATSAEPDFALARYTSAGVLDTTFDGDGKKTQFFPGQEWGSIAGLQLTADGKLMTAVTVGNLEPSADIGLARFNADGTLDVTYNSDGVTSANLDYLDTGARAVVMQPDGKILVAGTVSGTEGLWRFLADGSLDATFGTGGRIESLSIVNAEAVALALQTDGKIIVGFGSRFIVRLNPDGTLDTTFSGDALQTLPSDFNLTAVAVQVDGKVVIGGYRVVSGYQEFAVARLLTDGNLDTSFSTDGFASADVLIGNDYARVMTLQADGRILLVGESFNGVDYDMGVVRFNADGSLDSTFDGDGRRSLSLGANTADYATTVAVQSDGRILVGGRSGGNFVVARFLADGALDQSFTGDGHFTSIWDGTNSTIVGLAVASDGKILLAGKATSAASDENVYAARLLADGRIDTSFGGGLVASLNSPTNDTASAAALQADGKWVIVGTTTLQGGTRKDLLVLRHLGDAESAGPPPTITAVADQTLLEDQSTGLTIEIEVADPDTPASGLSVSATSLDAWVLPPSKLNLTNLGGGRWRLVIAGAAANQFGDVPIRLAVSDGVNLSTSDFLVRIRPVNDVPWFTAIGSTTAGAGVAKTVTYAPTLAAGPNNESGQSLTFLIDVPDPTFFEVLPTISSAGALTFKAAADRAGQSTTISVRLQDDGGTTDGGVDLTAARSLRIDVVAPPVITALDDLSINEGTSTPTLVFTVTDADTPVDSLTVSVAGDTASLLPASAFNLVSLGGGQYQLTVTPPTDAWGFGNVTVTVSDGAATVTESFRLDVVGVNDAPSLFVGFDQYAVNDELQVVADWAKNVTKGPGETSQNLTIDVTVDRPELFAVLPTISSTGTLTYQTAAGMSGPAVVTVVLRDDGGTANGGVDVSAPKSFIIRRLLHDSVAGDFDTSFDVDGLNSLSSPVTSFDQIRDIAVQADGRVVVVGSFAPGGTSIGEAFVARYLADGSLDATFGIGGITILDVSISNEIATSVAVAADGAVYVGFNASSIAYIARLHDNGSLDTTFAGDGTFNAANAAMTSVNALAIDADGKLLAGGSRGSDFSLLRLNLNGTLDTTFGSAGVFTKSIGAGADVFNDIVIQRDGAIVAVGATSDLTNADMLITRITPKGAYDLGFAASGIQKISWTTSTVAEVATGVALDAQGRIVVGGYNGALDFALARFETDGLLDATFDFDGLVTTNFPAAGSTTDRLRQLTILPDGKILAVGEAGGPLQIAVARYRIDGSLDTSFDGDGKQLLTFGDGVDFANVVALQNDGRVLLGGVSVSGGSPAAVLIRTNTAGVLDTSFDGDGIAKLNRGPSSQQFGSVIQLPNGKLLVGGAQYTTSTSGTGAFGTFSITRYNADGTVDASFGVNGTARSNSSASSAAEFRLALQSDGKILAVSANSGTINRFTVDGVLDTSFGSNSRAVTHPEMSTLQSIAVQADGKFVAVGTTNTSGTGIFRWTADGQVDLTFGPSGTGAVTFELGTSENLQQVLIAADGKIVAGGAANPGTGNQFLVVRLLADGTLDTSFSGDGMLLTAVGPVADTVQSIALQPDGKIIVAGHSFVTTTDQDWAIIRLDVDGAVDTSFGNNGLATFKLGNGSDVLSQIALQADGKIVVVGSSLSSPAATEAAVVRLLSDGRVDPTFASSGLLRFNFGPTADVARGVTLQADGRIVVVGNRIVDGRNVGFIARLKNETDVAPTVTDVYARGSTWAQSFLDYLAANNHGSSTFGLGMPDGLSQTTASLVWSNVNRLVVRFNRDIDASAASALLYTSSGQGLSPESFRYIDGRTLEFSIPTLTAGKFLLALNDLETTGISGLLLDGEWTTSVSTFGSGSGNHAAGGDFHFRFNVLPSDLDGNGTVTLSEYYLQRAKFGRGTTASDYDYRYDSDGNGTITIGESFLTRSRFGYSISSYAAPTPPPETEQFADSDHRRDVLAPWVGYVRIEGETPRLSEDINVEPQSFFDEGEVPQLLPDDAERLPDIAPYFGRQSLPHFTALDAAAFHDSALSDAAIDGPADFKVFGSISTGSVTPATSQTGGTIIVLPGIGWEIDRPLPVSFDSARHAALANWTGTTPWNRTSPQGVADAWREPLRPRSLSLGRILENALREETTAITTLPVDSEDSPRPELLALSTWGSSTSTPDDAASISRLNRPNSRRLRVPAAEQNDSFSLETDDSRTPRT